MLPISILNQPPAPRQQPRKKPLYARLAQEYYLPPIDSTGVSLAYLDKVDSGKVLRVPLIDLNRFLAECKPNQLRRVPFVNKDVAYDKLSRLVDELGLPDLGFSPGCRPDGEWLYRVARFCDRANVCHLFEMTDGDILEGGYDSINIELAKRKIVHSLGRQLTTTNRAELTLAIRKVQDHRSRIKSQSSELERLLIHRRKLEQAIAKDKVELEKSLDDAVRVGLEQVRVTTVPSERGDYNRLEKEVRQR